MGATAGAGVFAGGDGLIGGGFMEGRTPIRAFTEGAPKTSNTEVTSQTKIAKLKAA
jgi:hypothetical protein